MNKTFTSLLSIGLCVLLLTGGKGALAADDLASRKPVAAAQASERFDFQLYPNPSNGKEIQVNITGLKNISTVNIKIYSVIGNILMQKTDEVSPMSASVNVVPETELAKGVYFLSVEAGKEKVTKRLVVTN